MESSRDRRTVAKAKTINKYLGSDFVVKSSVGHIRDLLQAKKSTADAKERARSGLHPPLPPGASPLQGRAGYKSWC